MINMNNRLLLGVVLSLLLFITTVSAAACDTTPCGFGLYCIYGQCKPNLFLNSAVIVMGLTFLLIAMVYAIGRVLEHPRLLHWAETELWEVIGTAFILALYLGASGILDDLIGPAFYRTSIAYPGELRGGGAGTVPWTTVNAHVRGYLDGLMSEVKNAIRFTAAMGMLAGMVSSMSLSVTISPQSMYVPLFPAFGSLQQLLSMAMYAVVASAVQLQVQIKFVDLWDGMFTVLLPLGVLFRAFPLTRSAGSALIAIAVGFTIILPIAYLLIEDVATHYWNNNCAGTGASIEAIKPGTSISTGLEDMMRDYIEKALQPKGAFQCYAFKLGIEALLLPVFAYLITLNVARNLAAILGAHIDFSTLVRVI